MAFDREFSGPAGAPTATEQKATARARLDVASTQGAIRLLRSLLVASVLMPAALFVAAAWYDWREVNAQTSQTAMRMAQILREHGLKVFESHELTLDAVDDRIGGLDSPAIGASEDIHWFLVRLAQRHEQVTEIAILSAEGKVLSTSRSFPAPAADHSDREHFRVLREEHRGTFIAPPGAMRPNGMRLINISRRRTAADSSFNGVIVVALSLDRFSALYRSITSAAENSVTMARTDGAVLVREPPTTTGASRLSSSERLCPHDPFRRRAIPNRGGARRHRAHPRHRAGRSISGARELRPEPRGHVPQVAGRPHHLRHVRRGCGGWPLRDHVARAAPGPRAAARDRAMAGRSASARGGRGGVTPDAEDGGAGSAHRRRRPRLQQSADGGHRQYRSA